MARDRTDPAVILVIDNRDSFTFNLSHALGRFAEAVRVVSGDETSVAEILAAAPDGVVFSPGPGRPEGARLCLALAEAVPAHVPLLGVCLGHQVLCAAHGAQVVHASEPMHGRTSRLRHNGRGLFAGLPQGFLVARYHSLVVDQATLPPELEASAHTDDGTLMAVQHVHRPWASVQFHPESFLTEHGLAMVAAFVSLTQRVAASARR